MIGKDTPPTVGKKTQFKKGQSGNPAGKPKGTQHLSTWIQQLLNDPKFTIKLANGRTKRQVPAQALVMAALEQALDGDRHARDWLAKYGYGTKITVETPASEAADWFTGIAEQERELAAHAAKKRRPSPRKQAVAADAPLQDQG